MMSGLESSGCPDLHKFPGMWKYFWKQEASPNFWAMGSWTELGVKPLISFRFIKSCRKLSGWFAWNLAWFQKNLDYYYLLLLRHTGIFLASYQTCLLKIPPISQGHSSFHTEAFAWLQQSLWASCQSKDMTSAWAVWLDLRKYTRVWLPDLILPHVWYPKEWIHVWVLMYILLNRHFY